MTDTTTAATPKRERQFGRVYDHVAGTCIIVAAFDPAFRFVIDLNKAPEAMQRGFALQNFADFVVNEANETLKDPKAGADEPARRVASLATLQEAAQEAYEGKLDFRSGVGLGGMRSVIGVLGQALFELGKTYVKDQNGNTISFTDLHGARAAMKQLYNATEPKGPLVQAKDAAGAPIVLKDGTPRMVPANNGADGKPDQSAFLTGRMIFNALQAVPEVAAKVKELTANKPKKSGPVVELG